MSRRCRRKRKIGPVVVGILAALAGVAVVTQLPAIRRYLRIESM